MAENNPANGNGSSNGQGSAPRPREFTLRQLYLKDLSFESPNAPDVFGQALGEPDIKLNLRTAQRDVGNGMVEVSLHVSAHATAGEKSIFLVEVEQAGTFVVTGFPQDETRNILGIACPNTLFPYARETISTLVQRGGFPPLYLQPIDFAALFAAQNQKTAGNA
jgi:preprotein translocase subunit SecB